MCHGFPKVNKLYPAWRWELIMFAKQSRENLSPIKNEILLKSSLCDCFIQPIFSRQTIVFTLSDSSIRPLVSVQRWLSNQCYSSQKYTLTISRLPEVLPLIFYEIMLVYKILRVRMDSYDFFDHLQISLPPNVAPINNNEQVSCTYSYVKNIFCQIWHQPPSDTYSYFPCCYNVFVM